MTDQPNPGTSSDEGDPWASRIPPVAPGIPFQVDVRDEPSTPPFEPAEAGARAPAEAVAREPGTIGAGAPAGRRSSGLRWAIALVGVAAIVGITAAIIALAGGRPSPSVAVGYMPANTVSYGEYRLDLPGDQRAKMAGFLAKFPGFADQSNVQPKIYEIFDRIVGAVSSDAQTFTADIEPWFGGQIAMGSGPLSAESAFGSGDGGFGAMTQTPMNSFGSNTLVVVSLKDPAKAAAWIKKTGGTNLTEAAYNGATLYSSSGSVVAVTGTVMLLGNDASVRAAIDSKGQGKLADDAEFKAAFGTVSRDYVIFSYTEFRSLLQSFVARAGAGGALDSTTIDDELLSLVPAWQASSFRFEDDAIVGGAAYPSVDIGFGAKNKKSSLIGHVPPGTIIYAESHDVGPVLNAIIERLRKLPELGDSFKQIDSAAGVVGGFNGLFGWWGDAAVAVSKDADGSIGGGLLIQPTDAAAATRTFQTLRGFLAIAGGSSGVELRDVKHGDATITVLDFSEAAKSSGDLPPGVKTEIAYTVTNDIVVIGYGEAFVASVLDAGPGPSLADDGRFSDLVKRAGEENIGLSFVDARAIREFIEPLVKDKAPAEKWAFYEREIRPYLLPIDGFASGVRIDGDLNRLTQVVTVK